MCLQKAVFKPDLKEAVRGLGFFALMRCLGILVITCTLATSCIKDPLPLRFNYFGIKEFPSYVFETDSIHEPWLIRNIAELPFWMTDSLVTLVFELNQPASAWIGSVELESEISRVKTGDTLQIELRNLDGLPVDTFLVFISVNPDEVPEILNFEMTLNPSGHNPLSALVELTLDRPCRLSLNVEGENDNDLWWSFRDYQETFELQVVGLYPGKDNRVTIHYSDSLGVTGMTSFTISTAPLPLQFPDLSIPVSRPEEMEPGMLLLILEYEEESKPPVPWVVMLDEWGKVRWLYTGPFEHAFIRLRNGNFLSGFGDYAIEMDWLCRQVGELFEIPGLHDDLTETPEGNLIALTGRSPGQYDRMVEISRQSGAVVREWDLSRNLDAQRPANPEGHGTGWLHATNIHFNPMTSTMLITARNQSLVAELSYPEGNLHWIIGNPERWPDHFELMLMRPAGEPFDWPWGPYAAVYAHSDPLRILVFDNGINRSWKLPMALDESYSRAVEYEINPMRKEIKQVWEYGSQFGNSLFSYYLGDVDYLPVTGNRIICFGGMIRDLQGNAVPLFDAESGNPVPHKGSVLVREINLNGDILFELRISDPSDKYSGYRCRKVMKTHFSMN